MIQEVREHYHRYKDQYNLTEPSEDIIKVEAAEVGEFTDITQEIIQPWDHQQDKL